MQKIIFSLGVLWLILNSCNRPTMCTNSYLNIAFVGFDREDIDTIILMSYPVNDNYNHVVDSASISEVPSKKTTAYYYYTKLNDTIIIYTSTYNKNERINSNYDWKISIPLINRTVNISNIVNGQRNISCFKCECSNYINSFVQDGDTIIPKLVSDGTFYTNGYRVYIHH